MKRLVVCLLMAALILGGCVTMKLSWTHHKYTTPWNQEYQVPRCIPDFNAWVLRGVPFKVQDGVGLVMFEGYNPVNDDEWIIFVSIIDTRTEPKAAYLMYVQYISSMRAVINEKAQSKEFVDALLIKTGIPSMILTEGPMPSAEETEKMFAMFLATGKKNL